MSKQPYSTHNIYYPSIPYINTCQEITYNIYAIGISSLNNKSEIRTA